MGTGIVLDSRRKIGPKGKFRPFVLCMAHLSSTAGYSQLYRNTVRNVGQNACRNAAVYAGMDYATA